MGGGQRTKLFPIDSRLHHSSVLSIGLSAYAQFGDYLSQAWLQSSYFRS